MSGERIFEELEERWRDVTSRLHHHDLPSAPSPASQLAPEGHMTETATGTGVQDTIRKDYDEAIEEIENWIPELKKRAAKVADASADELAKFKSDPLIMNIVQTELHLPPTLVPLAIDFLRKIAVVASQPAAPADPPADPAAPADPVAPAEPAPAQ